MKHVIDKLKDPKQLRSHILTIIAAAVLIHMVVATIEAVWQNYRINQDVARLRDEIAQLHDDQLELQNLIAYLNTESFKEREARRKLGYRKPGEQVIALPNVALYDIDAGEAKSGEAQTADPTLTNPQKWWEYFLG